LSLLADYLDIKSLTSAPTSAQVTPESVFTADANTPSSLVMDIDISNPWIRAAPPNSPTLSAYLTIENNSTETLILHGVSSPLFENIMIHSTVIENDVASMQHLDNLKVEMDSRTHFEPMGNHLMLMGAMRELNLNDQVPLTLQTNIGNISFIARVLEQAPE
jgi:hypothetical protein